MKILSLCLLKMDVVHVNTLGEPLPTSNQTNFHHQACSFHPLPMHMSRKSWQVLIYDSRCTVKCCTWPLSSQQTDFTSRPLSFRYLTISVTSLASVTSSAFEYKYSCGALDGSFLIASCMSYWRNGVLRSESTNTIPRKYIRQYIAMMILVIIMRFIARDMASLNSFRSLYFAGPLSNMVPMILMCQYFLSQWTSSVR